MSEEKIRFISILCPIHSLTLKKIHRRWLCPKGDYELLECPSCGWMLVITAEKSYCLRCKHSLTLEETIKKYAKLLSISYKRAKSRICSELLMQT